MRKLLLACALSAVLGATIATTFQSEIFVDSKSVSAEPKGAEDHAGEARSADLTAADAEPPVSSNSDDFPSKELSIADRQRPVEFEAQPVIEEQTDLQVAAPVDTLGRELPPTHATLVQPPSLPDRLTTRELYEEFIKDSRDDAWAYPMEEGINQFISRRGAELGATFEYVGCGSRFCMIAGTLYGGEGQSAYDRILAEMMQSGWWQTHGGNNTTGYGADSEYRFLTILPRNHKDAARTKK